MQYDIHIYTDGSSLGNPGPGGYGIVMEWVSKSYVKEFLQGYKHTTNNRMELMAVIEALKKIKIKNLKIKVFSDSKYVIDAVEKEWVFGWQKKNYKGKKNADLWEEFLQYYPQFHIDFQWVKGHNGHPQNERCDTLAVKAAKSLDLLTDIGFEK